jgi:hypothetical protein
MQWSWSVRACNARRVAGVAAALCALALTACDTTNGPAASAGFPRGATVAFDSIDGLPPGQFQQLVEHLNSEAQSRRLAVISRDNQSAYRVRGYLSARVSRKQTTIAWVWDVFDGDDRRTLRITGEESADRRQQRDVWTVADDAMMQRIARTSMDELAAFLTSPEVAPGTPDSGPRAAVVGMRDTSPEGAGIFRIFQPDPAPITETAEPATASSSPVPLPRRRPTLTAALSAGESLQLVVSR